MSRRAFTTAAVISTWPAAAAGALDASLDGASLDAVLTGLDEIRRTHAVPSMSVAVVQSGTVVAAARGLADAQAKRPATPDTLYQAASISKFLAALTAVGLAQRGRVSLDGDVATYLARWRLPTLPPGSVAPVTLRRLFGMTAGCNIHGYSGYAPGDPLPGEVAILDGSPPSNALPVRVVTPPGRARAYSGGGCQVAQLALEDATGMDLAALAAVEVFEPLSMGRTGFLQPPSEPGSQEFAVAHDVRGAPLPGRWRVYPELAAAGAWSTPTDLAAIVVALTQAARGDATAPFGTDALKTIFTSVDGLGYGFGIALSSSRRIAMKRGNNAGFRGALVASPWTGQGAVVMTNGDAGEPVVDAAPRRAGAAFWLARHGGVAGMIVASLSLRALDQNAGNSAAENLALLCFTHHWIFDAAPKAARARGRCSAARNAWATRRAGVGPV